MTIFYIYRYILAIIIEAGYQSQGFCNASNCTQIENILLRNLIFHNSSRPGRIVCAEDQPCSNITFDNVQINGFFHDDWGACDNVVSSTFADVSPVGLEALCTAEGKSATTPSDTDSKKKQAMAIMFACLVFTIVVVGSLFYFSDGIRKGLDSIHWCCCGSKVSGGDHMEPLLFEVTHDEVLL